MEYYWFLNRDTLEIWGEPAAKHADSIDARVWLASLGAFELGVDDILYLGRGVDCPPQP